MNVSLIFPHQLFYPNPVLARSRKVILTKDPLFFKDEEYFLSLHKQKILLHELSIKCYAQELKSYGYDVKVLETDTIFKNRVRGESSVNLKEIINSLFGLIKIFKLKKKLEKSYFL